MDNEGQSIEEKPRALEVLGLLIEEHEKLLRVMNRGPFNLDAVTCIQLEQEKVTVLRDLLAEIDYWKEEIARVKAENQRMKNALAQVAEFLQVEFLK